MNRKSIISLITVMVFLLCAAILFSAYRSNPQPQNSSSSSSSGNSSSQVPSFEDSDLINNGVTSGQLSNFEKVLGQYLSSQNITYSTVSFSSIVREPTDPNATSPSSTLVFNVIVDGKDSYKAFLNSFSLSGIRLYLYNLNSNKLVYDSQYVGGVPGQ